MPLWLLLGIAGVGLTVVGLRWFARIPAGDLLQALRTFVAVFGMLAGTGLLLIGRLGLAVVIIAAAAMAMRSLWLARRPPDALPGDEAAPSSTVTTDLLEMRLDHRSGVLDGRVRAGPHAGRQLSGLELADLLRLRDAAGQQEPASVPLLEAYLDRRFPDWRNRERARHMSAGDGSMDERMALRILGLPPEADEQAIRAAHRQLLARVHPDHGGSDWLAARINEARDHLLKPRRRV